MRGWRDLWPGGLRDEEYSTLNLLALCRQGALGYNHARCEDCRHREWFASSCGNRHCPNCLGPRQAEWSEKVCGRLPDCPHFHVVFTVPEELHGFFERNYLTMSGAAFLRCFARHLAPKGFRRVRYFGLLAGKAGRHRQLPDAPQAAIGEKAPARTRPTCRACGGCRWRHTRFRSGPQGAAESTPWSAPALAALRENRFSLWNPDPG